MTGAEASNVDPLLAQAVSVLREDITEVARVGYNLAKEGARVAGAKARSLVGYSERRRSSAAQSPQWSWPTRGAPRCRRMPRRHGAVCIAPGVLVCSAEVKQLWLEPLDPERSRVQGAFMLMDGLWGSTSSGARRMESRWTIARRVVEAASTGRRTLAR